MILQKRNLLFSVGLFFAILFTYKIVFQNYFEQDEWAVMADMVVFGSMPFNEKIKVMFSTSSILSHFIPLTTLLSYAINKLFGLNYGMYAALSIAAHVLNSILVYLITLKLTRNIPIAIASSLFFGVHRLSSQVITWIAASLGAEASTLFLLLSILLFINYISSCRKQFFILSVISFIGSLLFKETSITLLLLFPMLLIINISAKKKVFLKKEISKTFVYLAAIAIYFGTKLAFSWLFPHPAPASINDTPPSILYTLIKILFYPIISFGQIYDPGGQLFNLSPRLIDDMYPFLNNISQTPKVVEFVIPDVLYLLLSFILIIIVGVTYINIKKGQPLLSKIIIVSILAFFLSILPYVPLPRFTSFLEPRYYYTPNIFASILAAIILYHWTKRLTLSILSSVAFIFIVGFIVYLNYYYIQIHMVNRVAVAQERKQILEDIKKGVPTLTKKKNIFYVTGNGPDYLIENLKVPFQSGFGNVLMMWYFDKKDIDPKLADLGFLYQLDDQGYKEANGSGFGYYYEIEKLSADINKGKFTLSDVIALYYDKRNKRTNLYNKELEKLINEKPL